MNNIDYNFTHSINNDRNQRKSNKSKNNHQVSPFNPIYLSAYFCIFLSLMTTKFEEYSWLSPVLFASLGYHLFLIFKKQNQTGYFPFFISLTGAGIMLLSIFSTNEKSIISFIGISLFIIGVTLNLFGRGHKKSI